MFPGEAAGGGEGDGDGGVEVGAGYVAEGVDQGGDGEAPDHADAREGDGAFGGQIHDDGAAAGED